MERNSQSDRYTQQNPINHQSLLDIAFADLKTIGSSPTAKVNYLITPKNACSTMKASLLGVYADPHDLFETIFLGGTVDFSKPIFCITRNPYDRAISAYIDKIIRQKNKYIYNEFFARYNLEIDRTITFREFLEHLRSDKTPHTLNEHFRPQFFLHNHAFVRPYFVGRLERMHEVQEFLNRHGIRLRTFRPHATGASSRRKALCRIERDLIREIYRLDFEAYDYDENHLNFVSPPSIEQEQSISIEFEIAASLRGTRAEKILTHAEKILAEGQQEAAKIYCASAFILDNDLFFRSAELFLRCSASPPKPEARSGSCLVRDFLDSRGAADRLVHLVRCFQSHIQKGDAISRYKVRQKLSQSKSRMKMLLRM